MCVCVCVFYILLNWKSEDYYKSNEPLKFKTPYMSIQNTSSALRQLIGRIDIANALRN